MGAKSGGALARIKPIMQRQLCVQMPPERVFDTARAPLSGVLDKLFLVSSHQSAETRIKAIAPEEVARRIVFSLQQERQDLLAYYMQFRFAFPDKRNEFIENTESLQRAMLQKALSGKESYSVTHPYPMSLSRLYEVVSPCLSPT
jgi:hypothetical protein